MAKAKKKSENKKTNESSKSKKSNSKNNTKKEDIVEQRRADKRVLDVIWAIIFIAVGIAIGQNTGLARLQCGKIAVFSVLRECFKKLAGLIKNVDRAGIVRADQMPCGIQREVLKKDIRDIQGAV